MHFPHFTPSCSLRLFNLLSYALLHPILKITQDLFPATVDFKIVVQLEYTNVWPTRVGHLRSGSKIQNCITQVSDYSTKFLHI